MMWTRTLRRAARRPTGQALVLGALLMFVVSLAALTTVNLGYAVAERVRLQNTADAAAYSMAAMESRAFNLYAFSNRAHVSHHVSAMNWQSLASFTYFMEAFMVDSVGLIQTMNPCVSRNFLARAMCGPLQAIPGVGAFISAIGAIGTLVKNLAHVFVSMLATADPDRVIGRMVIPAHRVLNQVMSGVSSAMLLSTLAYAQGTAADVVAANDPELSATSPPRILSGALSACMLSRSHVREAFEPLAFWQPIPPRERSDASAASLAKRVMGNITNATRFSCDRDGSNLPSFCKLGWITDREPTELLPIPPGLKSALGFLDGAHQEDGDRVPGWKLGQTKMLSYKLARGRNEAPGSLIEHGGNLIRDWTEPPGTPLSMLAQGDNIGSDDLYDFGPLTRVPLLGCQASSDPSQCWGDPARRKANNSRAKLPFRHMLKTSIWAMNPEEGPVGGIHYRLVHTRQDGTVFPRGRGAVRPAGTSGLDAELGLNRTMKGIFPVFTANVRGVEDGNHPWDGLVSFPNFEPGQFQAACSGPRWDGQADVHQAALRPEDFNQPTSWAMLNKTPAQLLNPQSATSGAGTNRPALLNAAASLSWMRGSKATRLVLDDTRKSFLGNAGMTAIARAQTYYHRPGNWAEPPNFFNPYWRPRLASVLQGRATFPLIDEALSLVPGPLSAMPQKLVVH